MSQPNSQTDANRQWQNKAKAADSAERKEDYIVLFLSAITVVLVMSGVVGPGFFKSLFF